MASRLRQFLKYYDENDLYRYKKAEYTIAFLFVISLYTIALVLLRINVLGYSHSSLIQMAIWIAIVLILLLLIRRNWLEFAVNLLILSALAKAFDYMATPIGLNIYIYLTLLSFNMAAIYLKKYQLYGSLLLSYLLMLYKLFTPTEGALHTSLLGLTNYHLSIIIGVPMFLFSVIYLSRIIDKEIHKSIRLIELSHTDALTGISNRLAFNNFEHHMNPSLPYCFLILDLDHFKKINDTYGHPVGDQVLIQFAHTLQEFIARKGTFFRLGGEEFGIVFEDMSEAEGYSSALRILKIIRATDFRLSTPLTTSIGMVYINSNWKHTELDGYYSLADQALYRAKSNGRDQIKVHRNK